MIKKVTRIAIGLVLALGLVLSSASITLAKPQPVAEIVNLHLDGTSLHFQLHLVNLPQAFYYKACIIHNDGSNLTDSAFSPIGKLSRADTSAEITRDTSSFGGVSGHYDVTVGVFNRKQTSLASTPSATYTCHFTVTFHEANGLADVIIQVFSDSELQNPIDGLLTTNSTGSASMDLPDGATYYYAASKTDYYEVSGNFTLSGAALTKYFTMEPMNIVTFVEANGLAGVSIQVYSDSAHQNPVRDPLATNSSGQASIDLPNGTFYYATSKTDYQSTSGQFTLLNSPCEVDFEMLPVYTVTFNETTGLSAVLIAIWDNTGLEWVGNIATNGTGQATIDLPNSDYAYFATKSGYVLVSQDFSVSGAAQSISFTMNVGYTVTFNETNGVAGVGIVIYSDPARTEGVVRDLFTNSSGQGTAFLADGTYYYLAMKTRYEDLLGNFTVSGATSTENLTMVPGPIFAQDFSGVAEYHLPEGWFAYNTNQAYVYDSSTAGGTAPELYIDYGDDPDTSYDYYVSTRDIDATDTTTVLNLSFKHYIHIYDFDLPFTYSVEVSIDGGSNWAPVLEETPTYAELQSYAIGPETVTIDLSAYVGNYVLICWRLQGYTWHSDGWQIDDVVVDGQ